MSCSLIYKFSLFSPYFFAIFSFFFSKSLLLFDMVSRIYLKAILIYFYVYIDGFILFIFISSPASPFVFIFFFFSSSSSSSSSSCRCLPAILLDPPDQILQNLRKSRTERRGRAGTDALSKQKQLNNKNSLIMKVIIKIDRTNNNHNKGKKNHRV